MYNDKLIKKYFELAKNSSKFSDYRKNIHIGAVMVYKNEIISIGYNMNKTNPMQYYYNKHRENNANDNDRDFVADNHLPSIHAEMKCLIDTKNLTNINWNKVSIFIYRESEDNHIRMCKPCPSCRQALIDRGIKNIYYTTEDGYVYERIN